MVNWGKYCFILVVQNLSSVAGHGTTLELHLQCSSEGYRPLKFLYFVYAGQGCFYNILAYPCILNFPITDEKPLTNLFC